MKKTNDYVSNLINISILDFKNNLEYAQREIKIIYVLKGYLKVKINQKEYDMKDSDFILVNSNELHSIHSEENGLYVSILLDYSILSKILSQKHLLFKCNSIENTTLADQNLRRSIKELLYIFIKQDFKLQREFHAIAFQLVSILILNYLSNNSEYKEDIYGKGSKERLGDIVQYIDDHYQEPLTLEEVAMHHFITVPYLSKYFKKHTGKNFLEYLNGVRLVHAVNELLQSNKPIINIALDNGFPTLASFNRVFNRHYQLKPAEYRKKMKKSINEKEDDSFKNVHDDGLLEVEKIKKIREYLDNAENNKMENFNESADDVQVQKQSIQVDKVVIFSKYWNKLINIGYAKDVLNSDMQEQIILMQNEIKFTYARVWGLFSDEMMIVDLLEKGVTYNFSNTNKILDFFVNNKLTPFIELGPKPKVISKSLEQTLVVKPLVMKNNDILEDYKNLIRAFLLNCVERYGIEEVEKWYFEIWNYYIDPFRDENIQLDHNVPPTHLYNKYFKEFAVLKKTINEIVPSAKVGGCGLQNFESKNIELFLTEWKKESVNPEFLSVYVYPYRSIENQHKKKIPMKNLQSTNPGYVQNALKQLRRTMKKTGFGDIELNVTEWNMSISNRDYLNDSCFKACYIVKNVIDNINQNHINMMGYWLSSDIFSDYKDSKNLIYGGAGLVTRNGIRKPSYYSFVLLKHLGEMFVAKGENYIVTKKSDHQYQILCFNYKHFNYSFYMHPEGSKGVDEQYDIFEDNETLKLSLTLQGIRNGKYRIKELMLNRNHGSILDKWLEFGAIDDVKQDEVDYLKQICMPLMKVKHTEVTNHSIILNEELEPHAVKLFELNLIFGK